MGLAVGIGGVLAVVTGTVITANAAWTMYRILQYHSAIASAANLSASSAMGIGQSVLAARTWVATAAQWAFNRRSGRTDNVGRRLRDCAGGRHRIRRL